MGGAWCAVPAQLPVPGALCLRRPGPCPQPSGALLPGTPAPPCPLWLDTCCPSAPGSVSAPASTACRHRSGGQGRWDGVCEAGVNRETGSVYFGAWEETAVDEERGDRIRGALRGRGLCGSLISCLPRGPEGAVPVSVPSERDVGRWRGRQGEHGGHPGEQLGPVITVEPWAARARCSALCLPAPAGCPAWLTALCSGPQVPAGLLLPRAVCVLHHQGVREELGGRALHPGGSRRSAQTGLMAAEPVGGSLSPVPLV